MPAPYRRSRAGAVARCRRVCPADCTPATVARVEDSPAVSRRRVLQASALAAVGFVAGCTGSDDTDPDPTSSTSPSSEPPEDPDVVLLISAISDEESLLNYCGDAVDRHRQLKNIITPVLKRQREHVRRLRSTLTDDQPRRNTTAAPVPGNPLQALNNLRQFASSAEETRFADCLATESGLLARLFASTSAAHALTVESIRDAR